MKLLALDSSGLVASVAILDGETLVAEYTLNYKKTHSQTLLPMLDEIVKMTQTELSEVVRPLLLQQVRVLSQVSELVLPLQKDWVLRLINQSFLFRH